MAVVRPFGPGASGEHVRDLQRRLAAAGFEPGPADGDFGVRTEKALRAFQGSRGIDVDGICGPHSWDALVESGYQLGHRLLYLHSPELRGDDVLELQSHLDALGFHTGRVDGICGPRTAGAIADFQRNAGLVADGICGPESAAELTRLSTRIDTRSGTAGLREREDLLNASPSLMSCRIAIGEAGGLDALAGAVRRVLNVRGATVLTLHHPVWSVQAERANEHHAHAFVGLEMHDAAGEVAFFSGITHESAGGRRLAELVTSAVGPVLGIPAKSRGMRIPILRETRMPAVLCRLGPPTRVVEHTAALGNALGTAISRWAQSPVETFSHG